jgi:DNA-binding response OmpR family regulator
MNQPRVLIVDDEENIRFILERTLKREGYVIETAEEGAQAIEKLKEGNFDLVLLDLYMEPVGGLQVLEAVRELGSNIVVIILTAHSSVESAVEALRLGAFDYLFKPSTPDVIRHRVRDGLLHRQKELQRQRLLSQIGSLHQMLDDLDVDPELPASPEVEERFTYSGKLMIDRHHRIATWEDELLDLTTAEFDILLCLVEASPEPLSSRELVNQAMGYDTEDFEASNIVKWHIHQLRSKIEPDKKNPQFIITVRYKGYMWRGD